MTILNTRKKEIPGIIKYGEELYSAAKDFYKPYHDMWEENYKYFNGVQWENRERPKGSKKITANLLYNLVMSSVAHMTTQRPIVRFLPIVKGASRDAEFFNNLLPILWEELHITTTLRNMLQQATLCQSSFAQRYYDPDANNYLGGYKVKDLDPFTCYPDIDCKYDLQEDCNWFIRAEEVSIVKLMSYWPEKANQIREEIGETTDERRESRFGAVQRSYAEPDIFQTVPHVGSDDLYKAPSEEWPRSGELKKKGVFKLMFIKDKFAKSEFKLLRKAGAETRNLVNQDVYTKWRVVAWVGHTVLSDGNSRFYDGELPVIQFKTQPMANSILGTNEVGQLIPLQDLYNDTLSDLSDHINQVSKPRAFYSPAAGLKSTWLSDFKRRLIAVKGRANEAYWPDRPPPMGPEAVFMLEEVPRLMESVLAQPEILQGIRPKGTRSAEALKQLAARAMPRTSQKLLRFEESIKVLTEKILLDYMTSLPEVATKMIKGEWFDFYPADFIESLVKVEVLPGSSMTTYHDEKVEKMVNILGAVQGLDPALQGIVLENSGIPEFQDIVEQLQAARPPGYDQIAAQGGQEGMAQNIPLTSEA
jgi:hypothetical protein